MDNNKYNPIACQLYDYVEIACVKQVQFSIQKKDGTIVTGKAITTHIRDKIEWLEYQFQGQTEFIRLDDISSLSATGDNPPFDTIRF